MTEGTGETKETAARKTAAAARGSKMISCKIAINGYDNMTTEVVTQAEADPGTEKARKELEEKVKERREEKKAQEEKEAKRREEKKAEEKAAERRTERKGLAEGREAGVSFDIKA